ncbi:hypothetical protein D3C79_950900 [compost metagenome]
MGDPLAQSVTGTAQLHLCPIDGDIARSRTFAAAKNADQRGLPGAIFSDQAMHLIKSEFSANLIKGQRAGIGHDDLRKAHGHRRAPVD